jgi:hypothetical protein
VLLVLNDKVGAKLIQDRFELGQDELKASKAFTFEEALKLMKECHDGLLGPMDTLKTVKQVIDGHTQILKTGFASKVKDQLKHFLTMHLYLHVPRTLHKTYSTLSKAEFAALTKYDAKLLPECIGFQPVKGTQFFESSLEAKQLFLNAGAEQGQIQLTPERLANLSKIVMFLEKNQKDSLKT